MKNQALVVVAIGLVLGLAIWRLVTAEGSVAQPSSVHSETASAETRSNRVLAEEPLVEPRLDLSLKETPSFDLEPASIAKSAIDIAQAKLASQINASLDGVLDINDILEQVLAFAELPLEQVVDFECDDRDEVAYRVLGTPEGTTAHFTVGMQKIVEDGEEFREYQLEIQLDTGQHEFNRSAMRDGPRTNVGLMISENGTLKRMGMITERHVSLHKSRSVGIDAYTGRFTSGAMWTVGLDDPLGAQTRTTGVIDGNYASAAEFNGVSPLRGDLQLDLELAERLRAAYMRSFRSIGNHPR